MTVPRQSDGSRCGIFTEPVDVEGIRYCLHKYISYYVFAFYWYTSKRLLSEGADWNNDDVNDTTPN
jgi:hypothetical protein